MARSALTNGRDVLADIDGRSTPARRLRDLIALFVADLGGDDAGLSEGQLCLVRRAAIMTVLCEQMETKFALDGASTSSTECYQRTTNSLRRILESRGIHEGRKARPVNEPHSLDDYIRQRSNGHRSNGRVRIIEHEADA
jgi:hypothetical protein